MRKNQVFCHSSFFNGDGRDDSPFAAVCCYDVHDSAVARVHCFATFDLCIVDVAALAVVGRVVAEFPVAVLAVGLAEIGWFVDSC